MWHFVLNLRSFEETIIIPAKTLRYFSRKTSLFFFSISLWGILLLFYKVLEVVLKHEKDLLQRHNFSNPFISFPMKPGSLISNLRMLQNNCKGKNRQGSCCSSFKKTSNWGLKIVAFLIFEKKQQQQQQAAWSPFPFLQIPTIVS